MPNDLDNNFTVILHGVDGEDYQLANDGGNGPMSTGTDEWCKMYANSVHRPLSRIRAEKIMDNPNVGYGKCPEGQLVMYRAILNKVDEKIISREDERREVQRREDVRVNALSKLTEEERQLLNL